MSAKDKNGVEVEATTRVAVDITFLRMHAPPADPAPKLPSDHLIVQVQNPHLPFYRFLHEAIGAPYLWWLRRVDPDGPLESLLHSPAIGVFVMYHGFQPAGFFELDRRVYPDINLSYFGLMPHMIGKGVGPAFLRAAVDRAWAFKPNSVMVNTCTADHPRALPAYKAAGFQTYRTAQEIWDIPDRLGMKIPDHLRA